MNKIIWYIVCGLSLSVPGVILYMTSLMAPGEWRNLMIFPLLGSIVAVTVILLSGKDLIE